jgi:hypothetical protein
MSEPNHPSQEQVNAAYLFTREQIRNNGLAPIEVERLLRKQGWSPQTAASIVADVAGLFRAGDPQPKARTPEPIKTDPLPDLRYRPAAEDQMKITDISPLGLTAMIILAGALVLQVRVSDLPPERLRMRVGGISVIIAAICWISRGRAIIDRGRGTITFTRGVFLTFATSRFSLDQFDRVQLRMARHPISGYPISGYDVYLVGAGENMAFLKHCPEYETSRRVAKEVASFLGLDLFDVSGRKPK